MKILKVKNLYGYPSYSKGVRDYAEKYGIQIILDRLSLLKLSKEDRMSDKPKILIDTYTALLNSEIPLVGYRLVNGFHLKDSLFPHPTQLGANVCSVKIQSNLKRVSPTTLVRALTAPIKKDFLDSLDPSTEEYNVVKNMFSRFLPPSLKDPFVPPKTSAGSREKNNKARLEKGQAEIEAAFGSKNSVDQPEPQPKSKLKAKLKKDPK